MWARDLGFNLNLRKCKRWGPVQPDGWALGIPADSPLHAIPKVPFTPGSGIKVLGVPVVHPEDDSFGSQCWNDRVKEVRKACSILSQLPDSHVQFTLLRFCLSACKVNDLLRATPLNMATRECSLFSRILRDTFGLISGCMVSDVQWRQCCLSIRCGGLGVADPSTTRIPARLASIVDWMSLGRTRIGLPDWVNPDPADALYCLTQASIAAGDIAPLTSWRTDQNGLRVAESPYTSQRWWTDKVYLRAQEELRATFEGQQGVRFASQTQPHALAWLAAAPSDGLRSHIPDADFRSLLKWHIGSPLGPSDTSVTLLCPRCNASLDGSGHHLVCCKFNQITRRHGAVQDFVLRTAQKAGFVARKEQGLEDGSRPGDVLITRLDSDGHAAVDITVRHTLTPSHPLTRATEVQNWQVRQEQEKHNKYDVACRRHGWRMLPLVVDCYGGVGQEGRTLLSQLIKATAGQLPRASGREMEANIWQQLGLTLAKEVGRQLSRILMANAQVIEEGAWAPSCHSPWA